MRDKPAGANVSSLHRLGNLDDSLAANLITLSPEVAATAMVDRFAVTGYIQGDVVDPDAVRRFIRRDCRRRTIKVRTYGLGDLVVVVDEARHDEWLASAGVEYQNAQGDAALAALATTRRLPH